MWFTYELGGLILNEGYPNVDLLGSLEFVLDVAITVRLRAGSRSLAFRAGGIALLGVAVSCFRANGLTRIGGRCDLRKEPRSLGQDILQEYDCICM